MHLQVKGVGKGQRGISAMMGAPHKSNQAKSALLRSMDKPALGRLHQGHFCHGRHDWGLSGGYDKLGQHYAVAKKKPPDEGDQVTTKLRRQETSFLRVPSPKAVQSETSNPLSLCHPWGHER
jgi:hypothetical protein